MGQHEPVTRAIRERNFIQEAMMLAKEMMQKMFYHNDQANERILDCAAKLEAGQRCAPSIFGRTLEEMLFHMFRTEWVFRTLAQEGRIEPSEMPRPEQFPNLEALRAFWGEEKQKRRAMLEDMDEDGLASRVSVQERDVSITSIAVWVMLTQVLMHNQQHRSEAAALLTSYGQSPGDLDFIFFA
ncbi:MAG: DinB family protein [Anaerolineales bacterium]|nr:DinB family protein [Anaerolineales bacterium]